MNIVSPVTGKIKKIYLNKEINRLEVVIKTKLFNWDNKICLPIGGEFLQEENKLWSINVGKPVIAKIGLNIKKTIFSFSPTIWVISEDIGVQGCVFGRIWGPCFVTILLPIQTQILIKTKDYVNAANTLIGSLIEGAQTR